jgi:hypothetical protein
MASTPLQNVRATDELWTAARDRAVRNGSNVSAVVRAALRAYIADEVHECGHPYSEHHGTRLECPDPLD